MFRFEVNIVEGRMLLNLCQSGVAVCFDIDPQEGQAFGVAIAEAIHPSMQPGAKVLQPEGHA